MVVCKHGTVSRLSFEQLCQSAVQLPCRTQQEVQSAFRQHLSQFQEHLGFGMLLLLFSLLMTRGIRCVWLSHVQQHLALACCCCCKLQVRQFLAQLQEHVGFGTLLLLFSLLMTRGITYVWLSSAVVSPYQDTYAEAILDARTTQLGTHPCMVNAVGLSVRTVEISIYRVGKAFGIYRKHRMSGQAIACCC